LGEINLEEMTRLQASKEAIFGKRTDLFDQSELERITTRKEYNAALERERNEQRRAMEMAQQQRIIADAAAAERTFLADQAEADRLNELELERLRLESEIDSDETLTAIDTLTARLAEEQRLAEEFINVNINGIDIPVDRDWYTKEHMIGEGADADLSSDVNLMQMQDSNGNMFYVDVGGVSKEGLPYLTQSAATNPMLTGDVLTTVFGDVAGLEQAANWEQRAGAGATLDNMAQHLPAQMATDLSGMLAAMEDDSWSNFLAAQGG